jgi:hypothetical protein
MKRQLFCAASILAVFINTAVFAQVSPGLMAGLGITQNTFNPLLFETPGSKTGFTAGGICDILLARNISLQPGIVYAERGSNDNYSVTSNLVLPGNNGLTLNYLAVPIDFLAKLPIGNNFRPYCLAGMNVGFLESAEEYSTYESNGRSIAINNYTTNNFHRFDFGLDFGFGAEFPVSGIIPFVQFSYYEGVANIVAPGNHYFETSMRNFGLEIHAGMKFRNLFTSSPHPQTS